MVIENCLATLTSPSCAGEFAFQSVVVSDATVILQMIRPDRPGLVSELAGWVAANGGNIRHADHHTDAGAGLFLSRIEWDLAGFGIPRQALSAAAAALAERLTGQAQVHFSDELPRVAILASKQSHCLQDLLWRVQSGELPMQVPLVIANHPDLEPLCAGFGVRFVCIPVERERKAEAGEHVCTVCSAAQSSTSVSSGRGDYG